MSAKPPAIDHEEGQNPNMFTLYKMLRDLGERVAKVEARLAIVLWALGLIVTLLITAGVTAALVAQ